jgi:hypothetical protein
LNFYFIFVCDFSGGFEHRLMSSHGTMNTVGRRCKKEVFSLESHPLLYETELKVLQKSTKSAFAPFSGFNKSHDDPYVF